MSASQHANAALNATMEDIRHLMVRSMKLQVGHLNAMVFAHEITKIIAKSLQEHGEASTPFSLMLLSCATEIRDHSDPVTRKIVTLPDWSSVRMDDPQIASYPRFIKIIGYQQPDQGSPAPTIVALPAPPTIATPPPAVMVPSPIQAPAPIKASVLAEPWEDTVKSLKRKVVRSKKFVSDDESADGAVIIVKPPGTSALAAKNAPADHLEPLPAASTGSTMSILTDVDELQVDQPSRADSPVIRPNDWSDDDAIATTEWPSQQLHPSTCVQCIKEDRPYLVRLSRKIGEVCKTCPACKDKKVKYVRLIPEAEDALQDIVAKKKAATASKAAVKEKKSRGRKPAKSTSHTPAKRSIKGTSPTENDLEGDVESPGVQHPLVDVAARDNDMQFPLDDLGVEADTPLIDHHTPLDLEVPVPSVQCAPTDPPAEEQSHPFGGDIEDTTHPLTLVDAPPATADPAPALGRRMDNLQVSNNQAQGWHAQMGERVSALEQDWEKKFTLLEAKVSNLETKTLNNSMISGNLASLINSIHPPNNPNPSFAPPPISGNSTSPYGTLPPAWFPGNPPAPASADEPLVSHVGRRYTHTWDESHVSPETSDPANPSNLPGAASALPSGTSSSVVPSMTSVYVHSRIMYDISAAMDSINAMTQPRYIIIREHMT
ncbi:uncharacterized protein F5891DRAFT_982085 [Suillus fuscotomentosus]|uniref:Uncharacterized protein n=1 Tax=Suillus fuscotomentosus TaxID=1912939 RepID=A0AAD4HHT9_9AGAM|nr:uncharacterized protein F5891DRAFT_982085 [Suillus fuscotomentosus]KAG1898185.1 hypothetical protein F5891DRAFT_982085 [Suillus fuscotomentosus]